MGHDIRPQDRHALGSCLRFRKEAINLIPRIFGNFIAELIPKARQVHGVPPRLKEAGHMNDVRNEERMLIVAPEMPVLLPKWSMGSTAFDAR